jgi:CheY-like chemotaxis protein
MFLSTLTKSAVVVSTNILIVEDESIIALDIEQSLISYGYYITAIATSADTALKAIQQLQPDLVLMDIQIQGSQDGIQTAALIKAQFNLPIVYLTAYIDAATLERINHIQPGGYVVKPFQDKDLYTAIETALQQG